MSRPAVVKMSRHILFALMQGPKDMQALQEVVSRGRSRVEDALTYLRKSGVVIFTVGIKGNSIYEYGGKHDARVA
jgi:predicted transcriptional regulator